MVLVDVKQKTRHQREMEKWGATGLHDLFQTFLDLGADAVIEELETYPDNEWKPENETEEMNSVAEIAKQGGYCTEKETGIILRLLQQKGLHSDK